MRLRSLAEAEVHVESLTNRVDALELLVSDHAQRFDTLQTPWWKRVWFWLDGWPTTDLNAPGRQWRPWHRSR